MKKMNGFRKMTAWVLVLGLMCGSIGAMADSSIKIENNTVTVDLEVPDTGKDDSGNDKDIEISEDAGNAIEITDNYGTVNLNQNLENNETPGDVKGGDYGILINGNRGDNAAVNLTVKDVTGDTKDGIQVIHNEASVKIEADKDSGRDTGILILNNAGTINLEVKDTGTDESGKDREAEIKGSTGIGIDILTNTGTINLNQNLENNETPGDVYGKDGGIWITDNNGENAAVNLTVKDVAGTYGDGIYVNSSDTAGTAGNITITADSISSESETCSGIRLYNSAGTVSVTADSVSGSMNGVKIDAGSGQAQDLVFTADLSGEGAAGITGAVNGLFVDTSASEHKNEITVKGKVTAEGNREDTVTGIRIDGNNATAVQADSVSATTTGTGKTAIAVDVTDGTVTIGQDKDATGNVTATATGGTATGIRAASGEGKTTSVDVKGTVSAGTTGLEIDDSSGTVEINQNDGFGDGNITGGETGIKVSSSTGEINIDANTVSGKTGIDVTGADTGDLKLEVTAENGVTGSEKGLAVNSEGTGKTNVDINAAVSVTGTEDIIGIDAKQATGTDGTVTVYADSVSVNQTGNADHVYGVYAYNATVIIGADQDAAGGVTVESIGDTLSKFGIYAQGKSDVTVEKGNVDISGNNGAAIHIGSIVSGNVATVTVKEGDVIGDVRGVSVISYYGGEGIVAVEKGTVESGGTGINVDAHSDSQNTVTVYGDVSGNEKGIASYAYENGSFNTVIAQSDVKSGDNGTGLSLFSNKDGENHILVEGTLSGGTAITLYNENAAANSTVTVWAAESKGEGKDLVAMANNVSTDTIDAFTKAINYIVKLTGSLKNDNVSTTKGNTVFVTEENKIIYGKETEEGAKYDYHTANEGENVILSAQLLEGMGLDGVYYNAEDKDKDGKIIEGANLLTLANGGLTKQDDGSVLLKMLFGGGMLLGLKTHTHNYSVFVRHEKEPTCTETGLDLYKCKYCDATITETVAIKSDNHSLADGAAKAVTCTEDGWDAYQYCTRCSYSTKKVIEASGHDFEDKLTAGTKTHWYACKNCDAKKDEANHIPGTPVKENEQLAKNGAVKSYEEVTYCTVCGTELSRETILGQDAIHNPNAGEADIAEDESMTGNDIDLNAIPMSMDVSSDDDDVVLEKLANCPDALKETAKQELAALKRSGYKIDCGCVAWSKSGKTAACTLKLSEKDVPDGAQIFVNGAAVQAELKDGYYYFEITLPEVVVVAHK